MKKILWSVVLLNMFFSCVSNDDAIKQAENRHPVEASSESSLPKELEDCDDKAKKAIEKPVAEEIPALQGNTDEGCTLE